MDVRGLFADMSDAEFNHNRAVVMRDVVSEIRDKLRGYADLNPIVLRTKPNISVSEDTMRTACVRLLADNKIIYWNPDEEGDEFTGYILTVVNRYKFEKLYLELAGRNAKEIREQLPNLAYYNPLTGRGFVNGNVIHLEPKSKHKAKEIFDALFASAPNPVPRERLIAILRLGNDTDVTRSLNTAFTNLCKRCKVKSDVIDLDGTGALNAIAIPFEKVPDFYIFPE